MKFKQVIIWTCALVVGGILGSLGVGWVNGFMDFVASAYTRLFQFVAVPTVALAILTAMASLGEGKSMGKVFARTLTFTVLTSFVAALVGLGLFLLIDPGTISPDALAAVSKDAGAMSQLARTPATVYGHILNALPNNLVNPFLTGNVLAVVLIAAGIGIAIAVLEKKSDNVKTLHKALCGLQEVFFGMIKGLIWALPAGIVAFAAQLAAQMSAGVVVGSIGKYVLVVLGGNAIQFFVILPLLCYLRGVNGYKVMRQMSPALLMALFTKSSAATLPVTVATAEANMKAKPWIARFILPLCCTINMNGCAAFIFVTSLFAGVRHRPHAARDARVVPHRDALRDRQRGRADGLLLPHALAHGGRERQPHDPRRDPADLHDHRHDRDGGKRVERLLHLRDRGQGPRQREEIK